MNQTQTTGWSPMVSGPDEDFANFLEFGDLQLNFPSFEGIPQNGGRVQQDAAMDTTMENVTEMPEYGEPHVPQQLNHSTSNPLLNGYGGNQGHLFDIQIPTEHFNQHPQAYAKGRPHYTQGMVPPTPNSIEMHGGHPAYFQMPVHQQAHMYEHYQRNHRDQQMIFTPLVSPAVTPHDAQMRYPDFPMPGEQFSPLTSPAIEAQNQATQASIQAAMRSSDTSDTTSPIDLNQNFNPSPPISNAAPIRRTRRKTMPTPKNPARSVKQSPAMKPQSRKKQPSSTTIPPKEVSGIIEEARKAKEAGAALLTASGKVPLQYSQDSSEAESISPEPLSEILMPPPATPKSSSDGRSPYLSAKQPGSQSTPVMPMTEEPATPASLMRIRKQAGKGVARVHEPSKLKEQAALAQSEHEQIMEDIALPEPAKGTRPKLAPIKTVEVGEDQVTPTMTGQKTPKIGTASAPLTATSSVFPSPQFKAMASPSTTGPSKRPESKALGRENKKRNSSSSIQVSPALRPRISPSIKPLLPEGTTVSPETSALLLASKSNYQNILEGTHLPGVSYPENLSTNLTSKRTSHKLAEQGRRNRINTALQEMASLLPPTTPSMNGNSVKSSSGNVKDGPQITDTLLTGTAAQQSNSKASTVELATEYIKSLQQELNDVRSKLEAAEKKLETSNGPT